MSDAAAVAAPVAPDPAQLALRAKVERTAHDFEASFLQVMLGQMFDSVDTGAFGGGHGEEAFKTFLTDAFARSMADHGGVGLSKALTNEMLKMQGLS